MNTTTMEVDGREALVVRRDGELPIATPGPTLDEATVRLHEAQDDYSAAKARATEANAEKRAAQEELNAAVAVALEAHAREHDPQLRLGDDAAERIRAAAATDDPEDE